MNEMLNDPNACLALALIACGLSIVAWAFVLRNRIMLWLEYVAAVLIVLMFIFAIIMTVLYFRGDLMLLQNLIMSFIKHD